VENGDVATALDAYRRGRAIIALSRLQQGARTAGTASLKLNDINTEVTAVRRERQRRESAG
jgi:hypothetical protein